MTPVRNSIAAAAAVHVFTASGIVAALLATLATINGKYDQAFVWLGVAFFIDGVDGIFARMTRVWEKIPRFSGETLDLVIDYITYVFLPAIMLLQAGFIRGWFGILLASLICMSSLYHFSDNESKSDDNCFVGFPAIWNVVAFYIFALQLSPVVTTLVILACVGLTFIPWKWVHPMRVEAHRPLTVIATVAWGVAAAVAIWRGLPAQGWVWWVLLAVAVYGVGLTVVFGRAPIGEGDNV